MNHRIRTKQGIRTFPSVLSLLLLVLGLPALLTMGFGTGAAQAQEQGQNLSLERAIEIALENSTELKIAEIDLKLAELTYKEVELNNLTKPSPSALLQAQNNVEIAEKTLQETRLDVAAKAEADYYGLLKAKNLLEVSEEAYDLAVEQLALTEAKYAAGTVAQIDVIRASSKVASAESSLLKAKGSYELAAIKLAKTLGLDSLEGYTLTEELSHETVDISLEDAIAIALENRVEMDQARSAVDVKKKDVEAADNDYTAPQTLEKARASLESSELKLKLQADKIELEVRQSYLSLLDAENRLVSLTKAVEECEEALRIARLRYDAGIGTDVEVMDAQADLTKARVDYVNALYDLNMARTSFKASMGAR